MPAGSPIREWFQRHVLCDCGNMVAKTSEAGEDSAAEDVDDRPDIDPETAELLYAHLRDGPAIQVQQGLGLDDKAQRALGVGGTALGLSAITTVSGAGWWTAGPILGALAAFLLLLVVVLISTAPKNFSVTTEPTRPSRISGPTADPRSSRASLKRLPGPTLGISVSTP